MLKVALIFYFCLWVILLIAGVMLWSLAVSSGTVDNVETSLPSCSRSRASRSMRIRSFVPAIGGLVLVVAGAGFTVLMAVLFNLISDVTGGVRFTVVEEETARPRRSDFVPAAGCWIGSSAQVSLSLAWCLPRDGQRTQRRGCESAPDEGAAADVPPDSSATDELPTPADAESGADPEIDGPTTGSSMATTTASVVGRTGL